MRPARSLPLLVLLAAGPAEAQGGMAQSGSEAFLACARITEDGERLQCYDRAVGALSAEGRRLAAERAAAAEAAAKARAEAEARAAAEAAERAKAARIKGFGARGGASAGREDRVDRIESAITETLTDSQGKRVFALDNGQLWRQTDGVFLSVVKPGTPATVRRSAMGGFMLRIESLGRSVPVTRIR